MLGSALAAPLIRRRGTTAVFVLALVVEGAGILLASVSPTLLTAALAFAAGGVGGGWLSVADALLLQERTPDAVLGRVRATADAAGSVGYTVSLALGGPLVAAVGARGTYAVSGAGCALAGLAALVALRRLASDGRAPDQSGRGPSTDDCHELGSKPSRR
jgi:MFS family permease